MSAVPIDVTPSARVLSQQELWGVRSHTNPTPREWTICQLAQSSNQRHPQA
ncbi:hypothetical protein [Microseira sp. BLCC-F43]|uniref:hypothetical protein n=1 Tax=Microseira sp. BLCC-F43 TaxID=3153602 RepID=UPI0035B9BC43